MIAQSFDRQSPAMSVLIVLVLSLAAVQSSSVVPCYRTWAPAPPEDGPRVCRFMGGGKYAKNWFALGTCSMCYRFVMPNQFHKELGVQANQRNPKNQMFALRLNMTHCLWANRSDPEAVSLISETFISGDEVQKWLSCCEAAEDCCSRMAAGELGPGGMDPSRTCPELWDSWACWRASPENSVQKKPCPSYIFVGDAPTCNVYAEKYCLDRGKWNQTTNYDPCGMEGTNLTYRAHWHIHVHIFSLILSIPALAILLGFKSLRNTRNMVHCQLLLVLILRGVEVILYKGLLMLPKLYGVKDSLVDMDGWQCRVIVFLDKATPSLVFSWYLCEGIYLHHLIMAAFREWKRLWPLYVMGWAGGLLPALVWTFVMVGLHVKTCWLAPPLQYQWITDGPRLLALAVNLILLLDITRVLITKLAMDHSRKTSHFRRTAQAAFMLAPVFGLQFLVTLLRPEPSDCLAEQAYYLASYIIDGLQGAIVALLYCYFNREVQMTVKRTVIAYLSKWWPNLMSHATASAVNTTVSRMSMSEISPGNRN